MNNNNCDYIGATGNYPIEENFIILDNKIDLTSNILNSNLSIKIYNTSNDLQSNINILKNDLWDVNSNNSNAIIKYTYENYELYNAINTTIYINENANSKIIFRSRFNNSQSQHNTEIRSDGKLYIYIDGNIIPPILPSWYNVGDTFEGIFIKDTEQDVAILGMGGALGEQQALIMKLSTQVQAMDHMFLASSVLASSPNLVSIGTELTNFALWQYVTGAFIAGLGAVAIGSAVIATRAEALANMINASYISSNALNAINLNSNISSNDKLIFTSNLENIKFINNQLIASNLYDFNILTGNINCNLTTPQFIKSLNNYDLISSNINTSNLSINNINIIDIINSNNQWINNNSNIYYNTGSVGIGINTPTQKLEVAGNIKCKNINLIDTENTTNGIYFSTAPTIENVKLTITNDNLTALSNFQVNFILNWNISFRVDFQDLRIFEDVNYTIPINYFIESVIPGVSANIWVRIPIMTATKDIYIKNGYSLSLGNADNVFEIYDSFLTFDTTNKWNAINTTQTINNGVIDIQNATGNRTGIESKNNMPLNTTIELITYALASSISAVYFRGNSANNYGIQARYDNRGAGNLGMGVILNNPYSNWAILSNPNPGEAFPVGVITKRKIKIEILNNNIKFWYASSLTDNYNLVHSYNFGSAVSYNTIGKLGITTHYSGNLYVDELKVYQSTTNIINTSQVVNYNNQADQTVIENRLYELPEKSELLLFKGNDINGVNGADRIRLRAGNILFDTYPDITTDRISENIRMIINQDGNVGIGTNAPNYKLEVKGTTKTDALIINNLNFNDFINNTSNGINSNIISTSNEINNKLDVINTTTSNLNNSIISTNYIFNSILDSSYCKKSTFLIETNYLITYNSINYYTYTIDLTKYLRYLQISDITKLLRFRINATLASSVGVFSYLTECEYKIMMSQSSSIGQSGGFHCRAFGIPEDLNLTKFDNYKFVKTNNIYQLVYLSPVQYAKFLITIIDEL